MKLYYTTKTQLLFLIFQFVVFGGYAQNFTFSGHVTSDTTWAADTLLIANDVIIDSNVTLTVMPGTFIHILGHYSIQSYGSIRAIGTISDSIVFTHLDTIQYADTSTTAGGWHGIRLLPRSTSDTSYFEYCHISNGKAVEPGTSVHDPNNEANKGGGIYLNSYAHLMVSNSTFYHNRANYSGGGLSVVHCSSISLLNNVFKYNQAFYSGGGAIIDSTTSTLILGNLFVANEALCNYPNNYVGGDGAGLAIYDNAIVGNNRFFNNNSVSGTLYLSSDSAFVYNNIISNNMGAGVLVNVGYFGSYTLINNTITNNFGYDPGGCGIYFFSNRAHMKNNIVYGNDCNHSWGEPIQVYNPYPNGAKADFAYSCNPDDPIYYEGVGNITENPLFVSPTLGAGPCYDGLQADWSLQDNSPCINTGTPDTTGLLLPAIDLASNPRIYGNRIDMGAYENQHVWVKINDSPAFAKQISVYPNPGTDRIMVAVPENNQELWIELFDGTGQLVLWERVYFNVCIFTPTQLAPGMYFYHIYNQDEVFKKGKWVKLQ